jgi:hypothetical protein
MRVLDPSFVASAPEIAVLEMLGDVCETAIISLIAAHPCLEGDHSQQSCSRDARSPCCLANSIIDLLADLDDAMIDYRDVVEAELDAELRHQDPPL